MNNSEVLLSLLQRNSDQIGKLVDFNAVTDALYELDLTAGNKELTKEIITNPHNFNQWVTEKLRANHCRYGVGGFLEHRTIYKGIPLFETALGPRLLHLGVDIWGNAGTPVYSPLAGMVHSFKDNDNFGDYGPTIILEHNIDGLTVFSLFGHLSRENLQGLSVGMHIQTSQKIGTLGPIEENGNWPPHLHFQLMFDMEGNWGDYPGACRFAEKGKYLKNIVNPQWVLQLPKAININNN
jgi:peptidoglycan LD-endopeptidase LytH